MARDTCKSNNGQLLQSSKDTCNNKLEVVGPLPYRWFHRRGQGALSMVSSKDAKEVGNREHHTHSGICVAFHLLFAAEKEWRVFISFPIRFFFELVNRNEGACRRYAIQKNPKAARQGLQANRQIQQLQSKQSNNRRGTLLLARLLSSTLVSSTRTRLHERSRVQALCGLPGVLPWCFISPRDDQSSGLQSDRRLEWQELHRLGTVDDKVFEL